jgi:hypothetical protein
MPLPKGPNPGGLPPRPGGGLPQPGNGGLPNPTQRPDNPLPSQRPSVNPQPNPQAFPEIPQEQPKLSGMDRLSEYDFGAREVEREPLNRNLREYEPEETYGNDDDYRDDSFEDDRLREVAERKSRETAQRFDRSMEEREPNKKAKNNVLKPQAGELDSKGQNVFVDKKNKKVEPFGGKKSSIKVNDLDRRKNMRQNAIIVQAVVIVLFVATLGFAAKNAFFPPVGLTQEDVQSIVYGTTGTTAFPVEQGGYFAESFMQAYLEYAPGQDDASSILQYFTRGALEPGGIIDGTVVGQNFKQTIVNGPIVYRSQPVTDSSAIYTVGSLVKVENTVPGTTDGAANTPVDSTSEDNGTQSNAASGDLVWKYYSISVYFDEEKNAFAIASKPTIVPTPEVLTTGDVPTAAPIGLGEEIPAETLSQVSPTIYGFLSAFRESDATNYDQLIPFLGEDPDTALLNGLGGVYNFKGGKANDQSVQIKAYGTETTLIKAVVEVTWVQTVAGSFVESKSSYVMDIQPISGGYDVTRFIPLAYVPTP